MRKKTGGFINEESSDIGKVYVQQFYLKIPAFNAFLSLKLCMFHIGDCLQCAWPGLKHLTLQMFST